MIKRITDIIPIHVRYFSARETFRVGDEVSVVKRLSQKEVDDFARLTGDTNPIHTSEVPPGKRFIHGAFLNGLVSGVIGTRLPGPGTILLSQKLSFIHKCCVDQEIEIVVKLVENRKIMKVIFECRQDDVVVLKGDARLMYMSDNMD